MRTKFVVSIVSLLAVVMAGTLQAQVITEQGFGIGLSWGTTTTQWESRLSLKGEKSGEDILSSGGIVRPRRDEAIIGQIVFVKDSEVAPSDFRFAFSTLATPREYDWKESTFHPKLGWVFVVEPVEFINSTVYDTPFQLRVWIRRGSQKFVRIIFKIRLGRDLGGVRDTLSRDVLFIRPIDPPDEPQCTPTRCAEAVQSDRSATPARVADPEIIDRNNAEILRVVGELDAKIEKVAEVVNANSERLDQHEAHIMRLDDWASRVVAQATISTEPTRQVATASQSQLERLQQKYAGRQSWVFALDEQSPASEARFTFWQMVANGWSKCQNQLIVRRGQEVFLPVSRMSGWCMFGLSGVYGSSPERVFDPDMPRVIILTGGEVR